MQKDPKIVRKYDQLYGCYFGLNLPWAAQPFNLNSIMFNNC